MIVSLLFTAAIVVATASMWLRRRRRAALRRASRVRAGSSPELAIAVRRFSEIDDHLARRWCHCGGYLERTGEGSRDAYGRRYRVARLRCQECEDPSEVFFDTTDVVH